MFLKKLEWNVFKSWNGMCLKVGMECFILKVKVGMECVLMEMDAVLRRWLEMRHTCQCAVRSSQPGPQS